MARLSGAEAIAREILQQARPVAIEMVFAARDQERLKSLIEAAVQAKDANRNIDAAPQS